MAVAKFLRQRFPDGLSLDRTVLLTCWQGPGDVPDVQRGASPAVPFVPDRGAPRDVPGGRPTGERGFATFKGCRHIRGLSTPGLLINVPYRLNIP